MAYYFVEWVIDQEADGPLAAAQKARMDQIRPGTTATVFYVTDGAGNRWKVDVDAPAGQKVEPA